MYSAYIKPNKRKITCEMDITLDRAIDFLESTPDSYVTDGSKTYTLEELRNAKSIRSISGSGEDSFSTGFGKVHENTSRELSSFTGDNPESSSERDYQWD